MPPKGKKAAKKTTSQKVRLTKSRSKTPYAPQVEFISRDAPPKKRANISKNAELLFPVSRVMKSLRKGNYAKRIGKGKKKFFEVMKKLY